MCGVVFFGTRYVSAVIYLDNKSKKELVKVGKLASFTHTHLPAGQQEVRPVHIHAFWSSGCRARPE